MSRRRLLTLAAVLTAAAMATQVGVPNLIADMNDSEIEFSVHDGDLNAGSATAGSVTPTTCATATPPALDIYTQGLGYLNSLKKPAMFMPGDNDWTDCDRVSNGSFNATERLQHERQVLFSGPYADRSFGKKQLDRRCRRHRCASAGTTDRAPRSPACRASRTAAGSSTRSSTPP